MPGSDVVKWGVLGLLALPPVHLSAGVPRKMLSPGKFTSAWHSAMSHPRPPPTHTRDLAKTPAQKVIPISITNTSWATSRPTGHRAGPCNRQRLLVKPCSSNPPPSGHPARSKATAAVRAHPRHPLQPTEHTAAGPSSPSSGELQRDGEGCLELRPSGEENHAVNGAKCPQAKEVSMGSPLTQ